MRKYVTRMKISTYSLLLLIFLSSCGAKQKTYRIVSLNGSNEQITNKYDKNPNKELRGFIAKYKEKFEKEMGIQVATSDQYMATGKPESLLTNFTSDQMKRFGDSVTRGDCDLAIMNVHGHRASLPKGSVTLENLYEIYSFDNAIVILKLKGSDLLNIFESYIQIGGAGISSNVKLVGIGDKLYSSTVGGKEIYPDKVYTIVTLDYLADGNDGMKALRKAISVERTGVLLRELMIDYVKNQTKEGKTLHSDLDGRIIISTPVTK